MFCISFLTRILQHGDIIISKAICFRNDAPKTLRTDDEWSEFGQ